MTSEEPALELMLDAIRKAWLEGTTCIVRVKDDFGGYEIATGKDDADCLRNFCADKTVEDCGLLDEDFV